LVVSAVSVVLVLLFPKSTYFTFVCVLLFNQIATSISFICTQREILM
jgi:hypothetical protein